MARLTLQFEDRVLKQYDVGRMATIGRLADNTITIDSPAVSSHHACVFRDGQNLAVEDLQSTNGTFVNGKRVSRQVLQHGDVVQVGRHQLVLDQTGGADPAAPGEDEVAIASGGETVFIDKRTLLARLMQSETDARKCDALLARLRDVETHVSRWRGATTERPSAPASVGMLRVLAGRSDQTEYNLEAHTSLIGKGSSSLVRLRGWFKPKMAVAITRNRQGYVATMLSRDVLINSRATSGRHELKDGDVLEVSGLLLEFRAGTASVD
jgi:hypothetical protein